jgi:Undecaprenyl-phosphate glucose phosphotransferase
MIRGRLKSVQFTLTLGVFLLPLISFALAGWLRFGTHWLPRYSTDADPASYFGLLLLTTVLWAIAAEHYGVNAIEIHLSGNAKVRGIFLASLMTFVVVLSAIFFYRSTTFSRIFVWTSGLFLLLLTLSLHRIFQWVCKLGKLRSRSTTQVLILGADEFAARAAESLLSNNLAPCSIKGHIRLANQANAVKHAPVYEVSDIEKLAIGNGFSDVIIAMPPALLGELPQIRKQLAPLCVPTRVVLDLGEEVSSRQHLFTVGNLLLLDLEVVPAESILYVILKRAFDVAFSAAVLTVVAPVFALIALAVRLSSAGPVIFAQDRVGLNGQLFRMYKFRTMTISTPRESDARWTVKDDPRCTRIGKILRQTGLDELPQFINVLKGDMSVVGPRPERPLFVQKFMQSVGNYNTRHHLKVGITGWAQVNGWRGDTSIEKRVEYDLYYVRNWTLAFDLLIVLLTLFRGFTNKNAY